MAQLQNPSALLVASCSWAEELLSATLMIFFDFFEAIPKFFSQRGSRGGGSELVSLVIINVGPQRRKRFLVSTASPLCAVLQQRDGRLLAKSGTQERFSSLILVEAHPVAITSGHVSLINRAHRPGLEQQARGRLGDSFVRAGRQGHFDSTWLAPRVMRR